jgi:hypothetical protein
MFKQSFNIFGDLVFTLPNNYGLEQFKLPDKITWYPICLRDGKIKDASHPTLKGQYENLSIEEVFTLLRKMAKFATVK